MRLPFSVIAATLIVGGWGVAEASCLNRPAQSIRTASPSGAGTIDVSPKAGETYDLRGVALRSNMPKYPLILRDAGDGACVTGAKIQGQQPRSLTWHQMKARYDGDGANFKYPKGRVTFEKLWIDNVSDAVSIPSPSRSGGVSWTVRSVYARFIRDDFVENDTCLPGEIDDVLVDGTFMFLSSRPGAKSSGGKRGQATTKIRNSLVRLQCMPDSTSDNSCTGTTSTGHLFKRSACSGPVDVENVIFRVDSHNSAGDAAMQFAPGRYKNVTVVWLGQGNYPVPVPSGVTVTRNVAVWDRARASWLARHGCNASGDNCAFLRRR